MKRKLEKALEGQCPYCGAFIEYESRNSFDDETVYGWHCDKCGHDGQDVFKTIFEGQVLVDENDEFLDAEEEQ